jgi:prepilin-type N-terminal cleavage/methylation domain-containing protein
MSRQEGVTLLEMLIVLSIIALLTAAALPSFAEWRQGARYREAARAVASALREARSIAIARNRESRVEFDLDRRRFRTTLGELPSGSATFGTVLRDWRELSGELVLRGKLDCSKETDFSIQFNPNGTANSHYLCIMECGPEPVCKFRVGVPSTITGRVIID